MSDLFGNPEDQFSHNEAHIHPKKFNKEASHSREIPSTDADGRAINADHPNHPKFFLEHVCPKLVIVTVFMATILSLNGIHSEIGYLSRLEQNYVVILHAQIKFF